MKQNPIKPAKAAQAAANTGLPSLQTAVMSPKRIPTHSPMRAPVQSPKRTDGKVARETIVRVALRLFAEQGYRNTSTRQIADAACVNISAIAYYFGDKQGLYRAAFVEPMGSLNAHAPQFDVAGMSIRESLHQLYIGMLAPLKLGELVQDCIRLHFREFVEPTGMWDEEIENEIKPHHAALLRLLMKALNLKRLDMDLQRLAMAMIGMGVHLFVCRNLILSIEPKLLANAEAVDTIAERLALYAEGMLNAEAQRRSALVER